MSHLIKNLMILFWGNEPLAAEMKLLEPQTVLLAAVKCFFAINEKISCPKKCFFLERKCSNLYEKNSKKLFLGYTYLQYFLLRKIIRFSFKIHFYFLHES